jgi:hypothetical protein
MNREKKNMSSDLKQKEDHFFAKITLRDNEIEALNRVATLCSERPLPYLVSIFVKLH